MGTHRSGGAAEAGGLNPPGDSDSPRFFGRRRGKRLRPRAEKLLAELLPRLDIALPKPGQFLAPPSLFSPAPVEVWLEIGFGGGEHLIEQARLHPEVGLIGCEVFRNGIASLLAHLDRAPEIQSVRVFPEDVRLLLPVLPGAGIGRVFILFPDPWPKSRHAERRLVNPETLDELARVMRLDAELRLASDDPNYVAWARRHLDDHPKFAPVQVTAERSELPADWPATRYEAKLLAGRPPTFFRYRRI